MVRLVPPLVLSISDPEKWAKEKQEREREREREERRARRSRGVKVRSKEEGTHKKKPGNPSWPTFRPGV